MDHVEVPDAPTVGGSLAAAMDRAAHHMANAKRRLRVRLITDHPDTLGGLVIKATIAARTGPELEAMDGKGVRVVPWANLDARVGDLVTLVDEAVAEIEAAISTAPSPAPRPSASADDLETDAYEALTDEAYAAITAAAGALLRRPGPMMSHQLAAEAVAVGALRLAALSGHQGRLEPDDLGQSLRLAITDLRRRMGEGERPLEKVGFDA
jgi:hypothetical protein